MLRVQRDDPVPGAEWAALAASAPGASFFHQPAWITALLGSYDYYRPALLTARDGAGRLAGGLPAVLSTRFGLRQLLALPYGTYADPIAAGGSGDRAAVTRALLDRWAVEARRPGVVRAHLVLRDPDVVSGRPLPGRRFEERDFRLDLDRDCEALWGQVFSGEVRTAARKAEKLGVTAAEAPGERGAAILDALYRRQAASWSNHTPFPPALFRNLVAAAPQTARVWVAEWNGEPAAAQLVLHHGETALSWIAVTTPAGRTANAQNLLYVRIISAACAGGSRVFSFGGAGGSPALETFKRAFGARPVSHAALLVEPAWFRPLHRIQYRLRGIDA